MKLLAAQNGVFSKPFYASETALIIKPENIERLDNTISNPTNNPLKIATIVSGNKKTELTTNEALGYINHEAKLQPVTNTARSSLPIRSLCWV